jgi:hypothetical protein
MIQEQFFFDLETSLHKKEVRNSREKVAELIADDFVEFGKSGGTFNKQDTLNGLAEEKIDLQIEISNFAIKQLSSEVTLVTYTAVMLDRDAVTKVSTNRSSVWILRDGKWQMVFHQGTRAED